METKICLECNKEFRKKSKDSKKQWKDRKYCSKSCSDKSRIGKTGYWFGKKLAKSFSDKRNNFEKGHTPWNKNKEWDNETKLKMSVAKKGKKNSHIGIPWTEESKLKMSNTNKGHFVSDETKDKIRQKCLNRKMRYFKDTSIEIKIENELIKRNIYYQKQVPLCKVARVDFYLPEYRIVIQADGCYWHNCPLHGKDKFTKSVEKDKHQDSVLTFHGFNVYRFWEHEINSSVEECINKINLCL